jgi:hypothetical protein
MNNTRIIIKKNVVDGAALATLYAFGMYVADGELPGYHTVIKFLVLFMVATTVLHAIDAPYVDAIPRGIAIVIAAKYVNSLGVL